MGSRKIAAVVATLVMMAMIPVLLLQPSGVASAGLSRGIAVPLENIYHLLLLLTIGIWAGCLGRESIILLPFTALIAVVVGMMMHASPAEMGVWRDAATLLLVQCYAAITGIMRRRAFLIAQIVLGTCGYWAGVDWVAQRPEQLPLLYYATGILLCALLIMAIGASVGIAAQFLRKPSPPIPVKP